MSHCAFLGERKKLAPKKNTKKKQSLHKKSGANKEDSILETVENSTYKISVGSGGREFSPNKSSSELGCPNGVGPGEKIYNPWKTNLRVSPPLTPGKKI